MNQTELEIQTRLAPEQIVQRLQYALIPQVIFKLEQTVPVFTFEGKINGSDFDIICYKRLPGRKNKYSESKLGLSVWGVGYVQRIRNSGLFHGHIQEMGEGANIHGYFGVTRGVKYSFIPFLLIIFFMIVQLFQDRFAVNIYDVVGTISVFFLWFVGIYYFFERPYRKAIIDFLHGLFEDVTMVTMSSESK